MDNLIAEGKSIIEDVNAVNYEETVDRANDWLQQIEIVISDKEVIDEIYEIAARVFKPKFINDNPFFSTPVLIKMEEKVAYFQEKVQDIIDVLQQQKLEF